PYLSPGATVLSDVSFKIGPKILHGGFERIGSPGREGAERVPGTPHLRLRCKLVEVAWLAVAVFHRAQNAFRPTEAAPARRAESAGFTREKLRHVPRHTHWTGMVIEHDHGSCPQAAAGFRHLGEVHGRVQVLFDDEGRGTATRQQSAKLQSVTHATGVLFENFADGRPHGQFPKAGTFHFSANTVELRAAIFRPAQAMEPLRAVIDDVWHATDGLHVIDHRWFAEQAHHDGEGRLRSRIRALALQRIE